MIYFKKLPGDQKLNDIARELNDLLNEDEKASFEIKRFLTRDVVVIKSLKDNTDHSLINLQESLLKSFLAKFPLIDE